MPSCNKCNRCRRRSQHCRRAPKQARKQASGSAEAPRRTEGAALQQAQALVGTAPPTRPARRKPPTAAEDVEASDEEEEGEAEDNLSTDNLLKMALVKLLQTGPGSKASKKKQALGVASLDSSSEEEDGLAKLSGAKGTVLGEKLKAAMKKNPEAYSDAILKLAAESVGSEVFRIEDLEQFVKEEMPVGTQKALGYSTWNLLHMYKFLHAGQVEKAKLQVLLGLAATEQFLLDQNWGSAERLLHIPKPPFQTWRANEGYINSLRGELSHSRLIPPTWAASIIARLRDEEVLVRRRGKFKGTGKGKDEKGTEKE